MNDTQTRTNKARKPKVTYPRKVREGNALVVIYRRKTPAGNMGYVIPKLVNGARKFESFTDEETAYEVAKRLALNISTGNVSAAQLSNEQAVEYSDARRALEPLQLSVRQVVNKVIECVAVGVPFPKLLEAAEFYALRHKQTQPKTIAQVIEELLKLKETRKASPRYLEDLKFRLDSKFKADFGTMRACNITTSEIQPWLDKFTGQSYLNYRRVLHLLFNFAIARGYASENPVLKVEKLKAKQTKTLIFTPDEMTRLLAAASEDFLPCLAIGAFAGLRSAEIERLEWSDIRLTGKNPLIVIGAEGAKTRRRRFVPIHSNLAAWLADYKDEKGKIWKGSHEDFYDEQQETARNTAVEANPETGARSVDAVVWKHNALRHSFGSYRFAEIEDEGRVASEMGNSPTMIHKHYRELVTKEDADLWFNICPQNAENIVALPQAVNQ